MATNIPEHMLGPVDSSSSPFAQLKTLPIGAVRFTTGFWSNHQNVNRTVSLKHGFRMLEKAGNLNNLRLAASSGEGNYRGRSFMDSDVYKWLEAVAWELANGADPELQSMADRTIELVAAAQCPEGYINSYYQVVEPQSRLVDLDHGHELYCAGHLFQAAVAFQRAVGDQKLMTAARRFADYLCSIFGPDRRHGTCGHPEVEMALVELYRATGERNYLNLATFFIDQRGQGKMTGLGPYGPEYHQDHMPVRKVNEAAGHTVRQLYLACGATDLYLETGEQALFDAMLRLWHDVVTTKLYITGGLGSRFDGEAFGDPYELPADQCYCEACSSIASFMWNWRMLLASGEARYADEMERTLYNSILASPALDGRHYFYINPLILREARFLRLSSNPPPSEGFVPTERPEWHDVACCPPNVMRLLGSLAYYLATHDVTGVQVHHYASADLACELAEDRRIRLSLTTDYPWQGRVRLEVAETGGFPWKLSLRLPEWSQRAGLSVNGRKIDPPAVRKGYILLERVWQIGDEIDLDLEMEPTFISPNPRIDATRGSVAIQRGPLVYCLEDLDQEVRGRLLDVQIDESRPLRAEWRSDLLGGVMGIEGAGRFVDSETWGEKLYRPEGQLRRLSGRPARLVAIPYYAWGNRGIGGMRVWIPRVNGT